ncbi:MAG: RNB domain-containing ribonuclease, partial [Gammaproteobacteria bacterium]
AIYDPDNRGHFGLAYDAYAHFTSPIRRYPDLLIHRAIKQVLARHPLSADALPALAKAGEHCSMTERRADDATGEVTDWLKCEFMMDKVGQEFSGVISGVTNFGIFVELAEIYVEGLVHITALPDDYYQFDPIKHALIGDRSGRRFRLGDSVKIQVSRVDLDQCKIDFVLEEGQRGSTRKKKSKLPVSKKKKMYKNKKKKKRA